MKDKPQNNGLPSAFIWLMVDCFTIDNACQYSNVYHDECAGPTSNIILVVCLQQIESTTPPFYLQPVVVWQRSLERLSRSVQTVNRRHQPCPLHVSDNNFRHADRDCYSDSQCFTQENYDGKHHFNQRDDGRSIKAKYPSHPRRYN